MFCTGGDLYGVTVFVFVFVFLMGDFDCDAVAPAAPVANAFALVVMCDLCLLYGLLDFLTVEIGTGTAVLLNGV